MKEDLEQRIKDADKMVNSSLRALSNKYKIDHFEVYTNYMKNWHIIFSNPQDGDDEFTAIYEALKETVAQYESIYKKKD